MEVPVDILHYFQLVTVGVASIGFFFNILIILGIYKTREMRGIADLSFNLNLAFSDLFVSITWISSQIYCLIQGVSLQDSGICEYFGFGLYMFMTASVFTLLAIAIFHARAIVWERGLGSSLQVSVVVVILWTLAISGSLFTVGIFYPSKFEVQPSKLYCFPNFVDQNLGTKIFNLSICVVLFTTPFVLCFLYYLIWKKLHKHQLYVATRRKTSGETAVALNINVMIIRRAIGLSCAFALVYYFQSSIFGYQVLTGTPVSWILDSIGASIVSLVTVVNPLLCFILDLKCRAAILTFLRYRKKNDVYSISLEK
jgi:hypothetical protein